MNNNLATLATATAIVCCGARTLDTRSQAENMGMRADGADAIILGWPSCSPYSSSPYERSGEP